MTVFSERIFRQRYFKVWRNRRWSVWINIINKSRIKAAQMSKAGLTVNRAVNKKGSEKKRQWIKTEEIKAMQACPAGLNKKPFSCAALWKPHLLNERKCKNKNGLPTRRSRPGDAPWKYLTVISKRVGRWGYIKDTDIISEQTSE